MADQKVKNYWPWALIGALALVVLLPCMCAALTALSVFRTFQSGPPLIPQPAFTYTGHDLEQLPEMQLIPVDAQRLDERLYNGGYGIAGRRIAYAAVAYGTNQAKADLGAYFDRELRSRGWSDCPNSVISGQGTPTTQSSQATPTWTTGHGRWCKGNLEFDFTTASHLFLTGTSQQVQAALQQYTTVYEISITEHSTSNKP